MILRRKYLRNLRNSLYVIIDPDVCLSNPLEVTKNVIKGGADIIQLRYKKQSDFEFLKLAESISKICHKFNIPFLINDRVDVAILVNADGVHLGQDDLPVNFVRKLLKNKIIGLSTHNKREVNFAIGLDVDYISFGPIFKTSTKLGLPEPVGLTGLKDIRRFVEKPLIAIGGINEENVRDVIKAGADGIAVISAICKSNNVLTTTRNIKNEILKGKNSINL